VYLILNWADFLIELVIKKDNSNEIAPVSKLKFNLLNKKLFIPRCFHIKNLKLQIVRQQFGKEESGISWGTVTIKGTHYNFEKQLKSKDEVSTIWIPPKNFAIDGFIENLIISLKTRFSNYSFVVKNVSFNIDLCYIK
jgi:hypothetical protein